MKITKAERVWLREHAELDGRGWRSAVQRVRRGSRHRDDPFDDGCLVPFAHGSRCYRAGWATVRIGWRAGRRAGALAALFMH